MKTFSNDSFSIPITSFVRSLSDLQKGGLCLSGIPNPPWYLKAMLWYEKNLLESSEQSCLKNKKNKKPGWESDQEQRGEEMEMNGGGTKGERPKPSQILLYPLKSKIEFLDSLLKLLSSCSNKKWALFLPNKTFPSISLHLCTSLLHSPSLFSCSLSFHFQNR